MVSLSGCALNKMVKMAQDQELTVTPSPLEVHADTVRFTTSAKLPLKMLKKNKTYTADVKYNYGGESVDAGNIVFNWADYPNAKTENPSKSETFSFPYQDAMRRGDLVVIGTAASANGKSKSTPEFKIADGVITTSKLVQPYYFYAYADHEYNTGEELEPTYVQFFFQQGSSYLRPTEVRSSRGRFLNAFIADKNVTRSVTITGTHSPEGAERINARLADDRAEAIEKYYRRQMGRYDYQGMADSIEFLPKAVVENWDSLKAELGRDERLTQTQKDEILSIINGSGSFEDKEDALHRLSSYRYLLSTVYPKTRTATTEILTVKEKKSLPEISALSKGITQGSVSMDTLSDAELAFSATLTPLLEEKEAIYQAAIKKNDRWQAHNDLATVYLQMAAEQTSESSMSNYLEQANTQLGIAKNRQESPEVYANMATLNMMQGDYDMGMQNLQKAMNMNPDEELRQGLNGMMGTLQIMRGMYSEAARSLSSAPDTAMVLYNRGLAQLLSDDFNNARASFDEAIQSDSELALAYYGSAIVAAQQGNEQAMADMLRQAIQKDASLRAYAIDDLEFQKYFDSQTFKDAVQ
ncbi:tetratricopeptide repeat protein [Catalinimonas alkaloidigena]|nr:hypothetical protein [Catalinimonas alkaloidigena]